MFNNDAVKKYIDLDEKKLYCDLESEENQHNVIAKDLSDKKSIIVNQEKVKLNISEADNGLSQIKTEYSIKSKNGGGLEWEDLYNDKGNNFINSSLRQIIDAYSYSESDNFGSAIDINLEHNSMKDHGREQSSDKETGNAEHEKQKYQTIDDNMDDGKSCIINTVRSADEIHNGLRQCNKTLENMSLTKSKLISDVEHTSTKHYGKKQQLDKDDDNEHETQNFQNSKVSIGDGNHDITNSIDEIHNDLTSCLDGTLGNISLINSALFNDLEHHLLKDHERGQLYKDKNNKEPETQKHQSNEDNIGNGNSFINATRNISVIHSDLGKSFDTTSNFTKLRNRIHNLEKHKYRSKDSIIKNNGAHSFLDKCRSKDCSKLRNKMPNLDKYLSKNCDRLKKRMHTLYGKEFHHSYEYTSQHSTKDGNTVKSVGEIFNDSTLCLSGIRKNSSSTKSEETSELGHSSYISQIPSEEGTQSFIKDTMRKQNTEDKSKDLTVYSKQLESFKKHSKEIQKENTQTVIENTMRKQKSTEDKSRGLAVYNRQLESFKKLNQAIQKKNVLKHPDTQPKVHYNKNDSEIVKNLKYNTSVINHESMTKKTQEHEREKRWDKDTNNKEVKTQKHQNIKDNIDNGNSCFINVTRVVNEIHNSVRPSLDTTLDSTKLKIRQHSSCSYKYGPKDYDEQKNRTCSENNYSSKNYTHLKKIISGSLHEKEARYHNYESELLDYYIHRRRVLKKIRKKLHKRRKELYKSVSELRKYDSEHNFNNDSTNSLQNPNIKDRELTPIYSELGYHYNFAKHLSDSTQTCQIYLEKRHDIDEAYKKEAERIQGLISRQINMINNHISQNDNVIEPVQFSSTAFSSQNINFHTQIFEIKHEPEEIGNEKITVEAKKKVCINVDVELHVKDIPVVTLYDNNDKAELSVHTDQKFKRGVSSINQIYTNSKIMQKNTEITMNCNDTVQQSSKNEFAYKEILVLTIIDSDEETCGNSAEEYENRANSIEKIHAQNVLEQEYQGDTQNNSPNLKYDLSKLKATYLPQIPSEGITQSLIKDTTEKQAVEGKSRSLAVYNKQVESLQKEKVIKHSESQSKINASKNDSQILRNLKSGSSTGGDEPITRIKDSFIASSIDKKCIEENELNEENFNNEINASLQESQGVANNDLPTSGKLTTNHVPQILSEMKKRTSEEKNRGLAVYSRQLESFKKLNQEIQKKNLIKHSKSPPIKDSKNNSEVVKNFKSGTSTNGDELINRIKDPFITSNSDKKCTEENEFNKENFKHQIKAFMQENQEIANDLSSSGKLKTTHLSQIPLEIKKRATEEKNRGLTVFNRQLESFKKLNQEIKKINVLKHSDTRSKIKDSANGSEVVRNSKSGKSADGDEPINKTKNTSSAPSIDKKYREKNYLHEEEFNNEINDFMQENQKVVNNNRPSSKIASGKSKSVCVPKIPLKEVKQSSVLNTVQKHTIEEKHAVAAIYNRQLESFKRLISEIQKIKVLNHSDSQSKIKDSKHSSEIVSNSKSGTSFVDDESVNKTESSLINPIVKVKCAEKNDLSEGKIMGQINISKDLTSNPVNQQMRKNPFEQVITPYKVTKTQNAIDVQSISNKNDNNNGYNTKLQSSDITVSSSISVLQMKKSECNNEKGIDYFHEFRNEAKLPKEAESGNSKIKTIIMDKNDFCHETLVNLPPEQKYRTDFIDWNHISKIVEESAAYAITESANINTSSDKLNTTINMPQISSEKIKQSSAIKKMNEQSTEGIRKSPFESLMTLIQKIQTKNVSKPCSDQSKINVRKDVLQVFRISETDTFLDDDKILSKIKESSIMPTSAMKHTKISDLNKEKFKIDMNTLGVVAFNSKCQKQEKKLSEPVIRHSKKDTTENRIDVHSILNNSINIRNINAKFQSSVMATSSSISILKIKKHGFNHEKNISYFQAQTFKVNHPTKEKKVEFLNSNTTKNIIDEIGKRSITERMEKWSNKNEKRLESLMTLNKTQKIKYDTETVRNSKTETPVENNKLLVKAQNSSFACRKKHTEKKNLTQEKFKGEINTLNDLTSNCDFLKKRKNVSKQSTRSSKVAKTKNYIDIYSIVKKNNNKCYDLKLQSSDITSSSSISIPTTESNRCYSEKERDYSQTLPSEVKCLPKEQNCQKICNLNSTTIIKDKNDFYNETFVDKPQENKYEADSIDWVHINKLLEESEEYASAESANSIPNKLSAATIMPPIYSEENNQSSAMEKMNKQSTDVTSENNLKSLNQKIQKKKNVKCLPALSKIKDTKVTNSKTGTSDDGSKLDKIKYSSIAGSTGKQYTEKKNISKKNFQNGVYSLENQTSNPECKKKRNKLSNPVTKSSKVEKNKHICNSYEQKDNKYCNSELQSSDITSSSSISTLMVESNRYKSEKEQKKTEFNNSHIVVVTEDEIDISDEPLVHKTQKHMHRDFNRRIHVGNALTEESQAFSEIELINQENVSDKLKMATCISQISPVETKQCSTTEKINEQCIEGKNGSKLESFKTHKEKIQKKNMMKCPSIQSKIKLNKNNFEVVKHSKAVSSVNVNEAVKIKDASIHSNIVSIENRDLNQENFQSEIHTLELALKPDIKNRKKESELATKLYKSSKVNNDYDIHSTLDKKNKIENSNTTLQSNGIVPSSSTLPKENNTYKSKTKTNYSQSQTTGVKHQTKEQNKNEFSNSNSILKAVKNKKDIYNQPPVNETQKHKYREDFVDKIKAENALMEESRASSTIEFGNSGNISGKLQMATNTLHISPVKMKQSSTKDKIIEQCIGGKSGSKLASPKTYKQIAQKKSMIKHSPIQSSIKINKYNSGADISVKDDESTKVKISSIPSNIIKKCTEKKDLNEENFGHKIHAFELALNPEYVTKRKTVSKLVTKPFTSNNVENHTDVHSITKSSNARLQSSDIVSSSNILSMDKNRSENKEKTTYFKTQVFGHQTKQQNKAAFGKFDNRVTTKEKNCIYNELFNDESEEEKYTADLSRRIQTKNALVQEGQALNKTKLSTSENASGKLKTAINISPFFSVETKQRSIPDKINKQRIKGKKESKLESVIAHKQKTQKKKMIKHPSQSKVKVSEDNSAAVKTLNDDKQIKIKVSPILLNVAKKHTEKKDLNQEKFENQINIAEQLTTDARYLKKRKRIPDHATAFSKSVKAKKLSDVHSILDTKNNIENSNGTLHSNDTVSPSFILPLANNTNEKKKENNYLQTQIDGDRHQTTEHNKTKFNNFDNRVTTEEKSCIYNELFSDESEEENYRADFYSRIYAKNVEEGQTYIKKQSLNSKNALDKLKVTTNTFQIPPQGPKQSLIAENKNVGQLESVKILIQKTQKKCVTECMPGKSKMNDTKVDFEVVENSNGSSPVKNMESFSKNKDFSVITSGHKKYTEQDQFDEENYRGKVNTAEDVAPKSNCIKKRKKSSKKISRLSKVTETNNLTDIHRITHQAKKQDLIEFSHFHNKAVTKSKNYIYNEPIVNVSQKEMCTAASIAKNNAENASMKESQAFTRAELKNSKNISDKLKADKTKQSFTVWRMNKQSSEEESPVKVESFKIFNKDEKNNMIKCSLTQPKIKCSQDQIVKNSKATTSVENDKSLIKIKSSCIASNINKKNIGGKRLKKEKIIDEINTSEDLVSNKKYFLRKRKSMSGHVTSLLKPNKINTHANINEIMSQKDSTNNCNATQHSSDIASLSFTLPKEKNRCKNENKISYFQAQIFGIKNHIKIESPKYDCRAYTKDKNNTNKELLVIIPQEEKHRADCISKILHENAFRKERKAFTNNESINSKNASSKLKEKSHMQKIPLKQNKITLKAKSLKQPIEDKSKYKLESVTTFNKTQKMNVRKCFSAQAMVNDAQVEVDRSSNHGNHGDCKVVLKKIEDVSIVSDITSTKKNNFNDKKFSWKVKAPEKMTSKSDHLKKRKCMSAQPKINNAQVKNDRSSNHGNHGDCKVVLKKIEDVSIVSNITSTKKNNFNDKKFSWEVPEKMTSKSDDLKKRKCMLAQPKINETTIEYEADRNSNFGTLIDCEVILNKIEDASVVSNTKNTDKNHFNEEKLTWEVKAPEKITSKFHCIKKRKCMLVQPKINDTQVDYEADRNSNRDTLIDCEVVLNKIEGTSIVSHITNTKKNYFNDEKFLTEVKAPEKMTSKSHCLEKRKCMLVQPKTNDTKADRNSYCGTLIDCEVVLNKTEDASIISNITNTEKKHFNEEKFAWKVKTLEKMTSNSNFLKKREKNSEVNFKADKNSDPDTSTDSMLSLNKIEDASIVSNITNTDKNNFNEEKLTWEVKAPEKMTSKSHCIKKRKCMLVQPKINDTQVKYEAERNSNCDTLKDCEVVLNKIEDASIVSHITNTENNYFNDEKFLSEVKTPEKMSSKFHHLEKIKCMSAQVKINDTEVEYKAERDSNRCTLIDCEVVLNKIEDASIVSHITNTEMNYFNDEKFLSEVRAPEKMTSKFHCLKKRKRMLVQPKINDTQIEYEADKNLNDTLIDCEVVLNKIEDSSIVSNITNIERNHFHEEKLIWEVKTPEKMAFNSNSLKKRKKMTQIDFKADKNSDPGTLNDSVLPLNKIQDFTIAPNITSMENDYVNKERFTGDTSSKCSSLRERKEESTKVTELSKLSEIKNPNSVQCNSKKKSNIERCHAILKGNLVAPTCSISNLREQLNEGRNENIHSMGKDISWKNRNQT